MTGLTILTRLTIVSRFTIVSIFSIFTGSRYFIVINISQPCRIGITELYSPIIYTVGIFLRTNKRGDAVDTVYTVSTVLTILAVIDGDGLAFSETERESRSSRKNDTLITSYASVVEMGTDPVIIGERINPTGKSKFKQALRDHNLEYILREAITQQENGAAVLDVNVGLPEIDEVAMMREVVQELQAVTELPLQIDTTDTEAMEQALRIYNGKALINSVNGKQEVMDAVFPLVKHYGGTVVALTIDEEGIPATADGRMAIARKICAEAEKYGIQKK